MRLLSGVALTLLLLGSLSGCSKSESGDGKPDAQAQSSAATAPAAPTGPHRVMVSLLDASKQTREQQEYLLQLQNIFQQAWVPSQSNKQYSVSCEITVTRDGYLAEIHPTSSSGNQRRIEQALDTIRKKAPFPAVPASFKDAPVTFRCDFLYNTGK